MKIRNKIIILNLIKNCIKILSTRPSNIMMIILIKIQTAFQKRFMLITKLNRFRNNKIMIWSLKTKKIKKLKATSSINSMILRQLSTIKKKNMKRAKFMRPIKFILIWTKPNDVKLMRNKATITTRNMLIKNLTYSKLKRFLIKRKMNHTISITKIPWIFATLRILTRKSLRTIFSLKKLT